MYIQFEHYYINCLYLHLLEYLSFSQMRTGKNTQVVLFLSIITVACCFQKTVKPVLVDTSPCPDFADVLSGSREVQFGKPPVICLDLTMAFLVGPRPPLRALMGGAVG